VDVDQEAVLAGDPLDAGDLWYLGEVLEAGGDARMGGAQPDDGLDVQAEPGRVDHRPVPGDHARLLQSLDPGGDRRLGQVDPPPDLGDAKASVGLQDGEDRMVGRVE
jgi:hypothetical protein